MLTRILKFQKTTALLLAPLMVSTALASAPKPEEPLKDVLERAVATSAKQYEWMLANQPVSKRMPRSVEHGKLVTVLERDWTVGFYPGTLWYLYEATGVAKWRASAEKSNALLVHEQNNTSTHDIGFIVNCSFGNGYRLTANPEYKPILLNAAKSLTTRYSPIVKSIKSWDRPLTVYNFPVIIDNMMNLELLLWAAANGGDENFKTIALAHADTTLAHHFRPDHSSYHVVDFDRETGNVIRKITHQGISDESAWARGQSWGLYGYTFMYRFTREARYLDIAEKIAAYMMNHPTLPADKIPYWDYNDPRGPKSPRDSSAAAISASALYELTNYTKDSARALSYRAFADAQLRSLCSPEYLAQPGTNHGFLLMKATGNHPKNSEINAPLNYADYYFIEAILRSPDFKKPTK